MPQQRHYVADVAAGSAGDALYVEGFKPNVVPTMDFSARRRAAGAAHYGDASALHPGAPGEVRAAPLAAGRYLVLVRSGTGLRSRAGSPATGFADPLVFSGTDASRLLGLAGAPSGLAVAAWVTTGGRVHAAIYDDSGRRHGGRRACPGCRCRRKRFAVRRRLAHAPRGSAGG